MRSDYCHRGHPFPPRDENGQRRCAECHRLAAQRRAGGLPPAPVTLIERIMRRIAIDANGCWVYPVTDKLSGYGRSTQNPESRGAKGKQIITHRATYMHFVGPIPDGLELDHLCRVRACCNPAHLEPVTRQENVLRGISPVARNAVATACKYGHPFDEANTYVNPFTGGRQCRTCRRAIDRARSPRRQAERMSA